MAFIENNNGPIIIREQKNYKDCIIVDHVEVHNPAPADVVYQEIMPEPEQAPAQETEPRQQPKKRPAAHPQHTQCTYSYRWYEQQPHRLARLMQGLLTLEWIAPDTDPDQFQQLFSGRPSTYVVQWLGSQTALYYLINTLESRQLITIEGSTKWVVTTSHFIDEHRRRFQDFNRQYAPKKLQSAIDTLIDQLDPSITR